jgi:hypothetical protein
MECQAAIDQTRAQVQNIPEGVKRIVVPVGSGMSLAGILWGLKDAGLKTQVVGVQVGADPGKRLNRWAPKGWRDMVKIVKSGEDYSRGIDGAEAGGVILDPHYEAKCLPFLKPGDLFWIVGIRQTSTENRELAMVAGGRPAPQWVQGDAEQVQELAGGEYDLLFSCPPYGDLEVYSNDEADLSAMAWGDFCSKYASIIKKSWGKLSLTHIPP